ncbi:hypothetical protein BC939DRAFT_253914 [Gamsiella multidivaricata]|uniref:uncharacterized protein n=1 Tax=Gamsiella multidivaricata TaxID=101098 RepID=UPI00221FBE66|nr:uncharacterized protein BC939DRAFT_253914 [Gamsiella multidivaricata]KAI7819625.1 hypothetical protein BC939DRAFT_253914 [Gamsiella multidivaricata]
MYRTIKQRQEDRWDVRRIIKRRVRITEASGNYADTKRTLAELSDRTEWMVSAMMQPQQNMECRAQQVHKDMDELKDDLRSTKRKLEDLHEDVLRTKYTTPLFRTNNGDNYFQLQPPTMQ